MAQVKPIKSSLFNVETGMVGVDYVSELSGAKAVKSGIRLRSANAVGRHSEEGQRGGLAGQVLCAGEVCKCVGAGNRLPWVSKRGGDLSLAVRPNFPQIGPRSCP